ncbi:MAG: M23 family metallopeptidase, partial [Alphaproteobacteria bacterium]
LGQSIKKTLMKTPVDGARMSSKFGMRRHPILGYNKMHKGVDFAAPLGTPIYAAGDGVLEKVGRNGGYGNYMRIRHTNGLKTAYAHLHKFAKGMSVGKRVKQGQVIGYIGSTGRSTGPHLHYEVILNGKQVNPNRVDLPIGDSLKGKDLDNFKRYISKYDQMYAELSRGQKFASLDSDNKEDEDKKKKAG